MAKQIFKIIDGKKVAFRSGSECQNFMVPISLKKNKRKIVQESRRKNR